MSITSEIVTGPVSISKFGDATASTLNLGKLCCSNCTVRVVCEVGVMAAATSGDSKLLSVCSVDHIPNMANYEVSSIIGDPVPLKTSVMTTTEATHNPSSFETEDVCEYTSHHEEST